MGAVLSFPSSAPQDDPGKALAFKARSLPTLQTFENATSQELLFVCHSVLERSQEILAFVDGNRELAQKAGIETIAIELGSILEGGGLERVLDGLEYSVLKDRPAQVSLEGLARLRRAENLLAEANNNIARFTGRWHGKELSGDAKPEATSNISSTDSLLWLSILVIGAIAIIGIVVAAQRSDRS